MYVVRTVSRVVLCSTVLLIAGCAGSPAVFSDHDPQQDFSSYQTFGWFDVQPPAAINGGATEQAASQRVQAAVKQVLMAKGFTFATSSQDADFVVGFSVGTREKLDVESSPYSDRQWRWGHQYHPFRYPIRASQNVDHLIYTEGTLSIDVYDVARQSPVWHSHAAKRLSAKEISGGGQGDSIARAVAVLLTNFPPP